MSDLVLGLIGDNIDRSQSPRLHRLAGRQCGLDVRYDKLIPKQLNQDFETVFESCKGRGYRGLNITYPYKELAARLVSCSDPTVAAIGAVNTVVFGDAGPEGYNTDFSGFIAAYRAARGERNPGKVCLIGTGGVGRAVAFGLAVLEAEELRLVDIDMAKAETLAQALAGSAPASRIVVEADVAAAAKGAGGVINCTNIGMYGHEGTPLPGALMRGASWAFDAVYTPGDTRFLADAAAQGLQVISGWELFFHQGIDAWQIFTGRPLDTEALRRDLMTRDTRQGSAA